VHLENLRLEARVITVGQMVHGTDQGVLVRARVDGAAGLLRPGQFVQARLERSSGQPLFRVSQSALLRTQGRTWVLVAESGGFRPQPVQVQSEESEQAVLSGPLRPGDRVVVSGTAALKAAWLSGGQ
jgi:cobalt-zinc-cadmium efflux system membrane fusion protein